MTIFQFITERCRSSLDEQKWYTRAQEVRFDCGCHFIDGGAIHLCARGRVINGVLSHLDDMDMARERARLSVLDLTAKDKNFLRGLKIGF